MIFSSSTRRGNLVIECDRSVTCAGWQFSIDRTLKNKVSLRYEEKRNRWIKYNLKKKRRNLQRLLARARTIGPSLNIILFERIIMCASSNHVRYLRTNTKDLGIAWAVRGYSPSRKPTVFFSRRISHCTRSHMYNYANDNDIFIESAITSWK